MAETFTGSFNQAGNHRIEDRERFHDFKHKWAGEMMLITYQPIVEMKGKEQLFAYYNGVLLPWGTKTFRNYGWDVDDYRTEIELMARFGTETATVDGNTIPVIPSKSRWTKERLCRFIDDVILFFMTEFNEEAPDAVQYLADQEKLKTYKRLSVLSRSKEDFE